MAKKTPKYDPQKIDGLSKVNPYWYIKGIKESEVEPIIELLGTSAISETIKQSLRKYLIVLLISALEYFFKNESKFVIDNNDLDTSEMKKERFIEN